MSGATYVPQDVSAHQQGAWKAVFARFKKLEGSVAAAGSSSGGSTQGLAAQVALLQQQVQQLATKVGNLGGTQRTFGFFSG